jgi:hypothetical protein
MYKQRSIKLLVTVTYMFVCVMKGVCMSGCVCLSVVFLLLSFKLSLGCLFSL